MERNASYAFVGFLTLALIAGLLGFAFFARSRLGDLTFVGNGLGGYFLSGEILRPHRGDLLSGPTYSVGILADVLHEYANGRR